MRPTDPAPTPSTPVASGPGEPDGLAWPVVLRALREARGVTQDGWAAQLGVSRKTVQRWEAGERAPDPGAEAALLAYCRERNLFRAFTRGPLAGLELTPDLLHDLLAEARLGTGQQRATGSADAAGLTTTAALAAPSSNLPVALTSFVGREAELAALRRTLAGTRLLTLTGPGGCGKTRLSLQVAGELLWAYPHGVWLVELAALSDPALVAQTVAAALGLHTAERRPPLETIKDFVRDRSLLLVLDNCEHLLAACAVLTEALLRAGAALEVMATSRGPLGVPGETIWRVPPMSVPRSKFQVPSETGAFLEPGTLNVEHEQADSVRLFVERARLYRPEFELTLGNAGAVAAVCRQLDGIPLAIELAAARVTLLSVEQIAARLEDRLHLLTGGSRRAPPRQQTLRATLDWSYDLLTDQERAFLRRLAVFAGGFDIEAADRVCGLRAKGEGQRAEDRPSPSPLEDVLDTLASLVDKSLVLAEEHDGAARYRLLETVRQYADEQLDKAGETAVARGRHLEWCAALALAASAAFQSPDESTWLDRLEEEHDNLRAALRWSLTQSEAEAEMALRLAGRLPRFWELRGHLGEGRQWLEQALTAGGQASAGVRAKALLGAGRLAYAQGDYVTARALYESSLRLSEDLGDRERIADARRELGMVALRYGEYAVARTLLDTSLGIHAELGNKSGIASVQSALGLLALRQSDHATARAHLEASALLRRELGDKRGLANALDDLATIAGVLGDAASQATVMEENLALYRELGAKGGVARVLNYLGMTVWMLGDHERAIALMEESLALYRDRGEARGIAGVLGNMGLVALSRRDYARAVRACRESLALYREIGDAWGASHHLPVLAGAIFGQGQGEKAVRLCGAAAAVRERLGTPLPLPLRPHHDRMIAVMRRRLGEQVFATAWEAGEAMSWEAAVTYALADAPVG